MNRGHLLVAMVRVGLFEIKSTFAKRIAVLENCAMKVSKILSHDEKENVRSPSSSSIGPLVSGYRTKMIPVSHANQHWRFVSLYSRVFLVFKCTYHIDDVQLPVQVLQSNWVDELVECRAGS